MIRGLLQRGERAEHMLPIDDVATLCRVSSSKVKQWLTRRQAARSTPDRREVELGELLSFLLSHRMPVPTSLLPPHTGKLLFIIAEAGDLEAKQAVIDDICTLFLQFKTYALVETSILSRSTQLSILTFMPERTVILTSDSSITTSLKSIITLLAGLPASKTLLLGASSNTLEDTGYNRQLPDDLVVLEDVADDKARDRLRHFFTD